MARGKKKRSHPYDDFDQDGHGWGRYRSVAERRQDSEQVQFNIDTQYIGFGLRINAFNRAIDY